MLIEYVVAMIIPIPSKIKKSSNQLVKKDLKNDIMNSFNICAMLITSFVYSYLTPPRSLR